MVTRGLPHTPSGQSQISSSTFSSAAADKVGPSSSGASSSSSGSHLADLPWGQFLRNRVFWALLVAHSVFGVGYSMFIAWLPTYYNQVSTSTCEFSSAWRQDPLKPCRHVAAAPAALK